MTPKIPGLRVFTEAEPSCAGSQDTEATEAAADCQQDTTKYLKRHQLPILRPLNQGSASEAVSIKDQIGRAETEWTQVPKHFNHGHIAIL